MAIDRKYGRVTLERGTIGEDEPVVVFRAQDQMLIGLLDHYYVMCSEAGSPQRHLNAIQLARYQVAGWQDCHGNHTKVPESATFDPDVT